MRISMWYTKTYEDGFQGADIIEEFENLKEAWNCFINHKEIHPDDYNLMLCVDGVAIAKNEREEK